MVLQMIDVSLPNLIIRLFLLLLLLVSEDIYSILWRLCRASRMPWAAESTNKFDFTFITYFICSLQLKVVISVRWVELVDLKA